MRKRIQINIDFSKLENAVNSGKRITVKSLAHTHGVSPLVVRNALNEKYNTAIKYMRGRNGGIVIANS